MLPTALDTPLQFEPEMCLNMLHMNLKKKKMGWEKKNDKSRVVLWCKNRVIFLRKYEKFRASSSKMFSKEIKIIFRSSKSYYTQLLSILKIRFDFFNIDVELASNFIRENSYKIFQKTEPQTLNITRTIIFRELTMV